MPAITTEERTTLADREVRQAQARVLSARTDLATVAADKPWDHLPAYVNAVARAQAQADVWSQIRAMAPFGFDNLDGLLWSISTQQVGDNYSGSGQEATRAYADARRQAVMDARWSLGLAS